MTRTREGIPYEFEVLTWAQRFGGGGGFLALLSPVGKITRVYRGD